VRGVGVRSRLPAIDGVRALAAVAVIAYHSHRTVPGGYIGVDVFFVISGFVITRLLLDRIGRGRLSLRGFYRDRLLRLGPPLLVMAVVVAIAALVGLGPRSSLGWLPAVLTYTVDFVRIANPTQQTAFSHTWSLGVEEQYYLVWPLLLCLVAGRRRRPQAVAILCGAGIVVSVAVALLLTRSEGATAAYYRIFNGPDTRAVQLLVGGLVAVAVGSSATGRARRILAPVAGLLAPFALGFLVWWVLAVPPSEYYRNEAAAMPLIALASAVLIVALATRPRHAVTRLLGARWLSVAGARYSYSLYLWHYPVLVVLAPDLSTHPVVCFAEALGLSAVFAVASWHLLEARLAARRHRGGGPLAVRASSASPAGAAAQQSGAGAEAAA
jgi:peptidoglycan/LPS O-acetylase OafA/YrhL